MRRAARRARHRARPPELPRVPFADPPRRVRAGDLPKRQAERDPRPSMRVSFSTPPSARNRRAARNQLSLEELAVTLPPLFAEACGYRGKARYVALCWIPELGELWWSDDGEALLWTPSPFLTLCRQPATAGALSEYRSAATLENIRPWLLVDRGRRTLSS